MKLTMKSAFLSCAALASVLSTVPAMAAQEKLTICHNGETMQVPKSALGEHLGHGDSLGPCGPDAGFRINTQFRAATGDSDFDDFLRNLNTVAGGKLTVFMSDLSVSYKVPEKDVKFLIYSKKMQPADAFMVLQVVKTKRQAF